MSPLESNTDTRATDLTNGDSDGLGNSLSLAHTERRCRIEDQSFRVAHGTLLVQEAIMPQIYLACQHVFLVFHRNYFKVKLFWNILNRAASRLLLKLTPLIVLGLSHVSGR